MFFYEMKNIGFFHMVKHFSWIANSSQHSLKYYYNYACFPGKDLETP